MPRKTNRSKQFEKQGRRLGKELGRLVGRLEQETRVATRKGKLMEGQVRRRTIQALRRGAGALNKLAVQVERSGRSASRSRRRGRRGAKRRR